jgi:hypothetical protein
MEHSVMSNHLERDVRFLKRYAVLSTLALGLLSLAAFSRQGQKAKFEEIDVERINVVEKDGKLRLVISNKDRSPGPIYKGKPFGYAGGNRPGMLFFNDEGSENGGLGFSGRRLPDGTVDANTGLSFDQFDEDQVLVLNYSDRRGRRNVGMSILDRADVNMYDWVHRRDTINAMPNGAAKDSALKAWLEPRPGEPLAAERLLVGRDESKRAVVSLNDKFGKPRLRLVVDSLGAARIEFLDAQGRATMTLPDSASRGKR